MRPLTAGVFTFLALGQRVLVVVELSAPENTNALQVGLRFRPRASDGDIDQQSPHLLEH